MNRLLRRNVMLLGIGVLVLASTAYALGRTLGLPVLGRQRVNQRQATDEEALRDRANAPPFALPPGPTSWVPFIAEVHVIQEGIESIEMWYRRSDGSKRIEAYTPDRSERAVTIHNFTDNTTYYENPQHEWSMLPLAMRTEPPHTIRVTRDGTLSPVTETIRGFTAYRLTQRTGDLSWFAPDLNFLELRQEIPGAGRIREFREIRRVEPATELFQPPAGVPVRQATSIKDLLVAQKR